MAKKERFGGFQRATKTQVKWEIAELLEGLTGDYFGSASGSFVLHPQDIRARLQDVVANDRFWKDYEAGFLMRFPPAKLAERPSLCWREPTVLKTKSSRAKGKTAAKAKR